MKIGFITFFSTEFKRYRVVGQETMKEYQGLRMCCNCNKLIYNRLSREPFCAKHLTPVVWYETCAYFKPTWMIKI